MLYTAEEKERSKETDIGKRRKEEKSDGLESYEYRPQLGSTYIGKFYPKVFQLKFNLKAGNPPQLYYIDPSQIEERDSIRDPILSQAIFSPDAEQILLTAYPALIDGRRLGLAACPNRPSIVYCIDGKPSKKRHDDSTDEKEVTNNNYTIKDALAWKPEKWRRLSREGYSGRGGAIVSKNKCVWLECRSGGPHNGSDVIYSVDPSDLDGKHQISCEIDEIDVPKSQTAFPGLFVDTTLTRSCSLSRLDAIAITTIWGSRQTIVLHRLGQDSVPIELTPLGISVANQASEVEQPWSYNLLCTNGNDLLIAVRSSPICPQQILIGRISEKQGQPQAEWSLIKSMDESWQDEKAIRDLKQSALAKIIPIPTTGVKEDVNDQSIEAILLSPSTSDNPLPLLLELHGGPHGSSLTAFSPALAAICLSGCECTLLRFLHGRILTLIPNNRLNLATQLPRISWKGTTLCRIFDW